MTNTLAYFSTQLLIKNKFFNTNTLQNIIKTTILWQLFKEYKNYIKTLLFNKAYQHFLILKELMLIFDKNSQQI
jgi:hypothetical protein